jgi:2-C-methyl-D-erythritol 4-phosphate cytidylyltransferase
MSTESKVTLLLMMGGSGVRFGTEIPKQFVEVEGKPVFSYILEKYSACALVDRIVAVCHASWIDFTCDWIGKLDLNVDIDVVAGGVTRSHSVKNGLLSVAPQASPDEVILIHDVTHPYVDETTLPSLIELAKETGAATLVECQYDTVYSVDPTSNRIQDVIPRETIVAGASPEAFIFSGIWAAFNSIDDNKLEQFTSVGSLAKAQGISMGVMKTDLINLKITHRQDMKVFKRLLPDYFPSLRM